MADPEELFARAVVADEEDRVVEALTLYERVVHALVAARADREPGDQRLMLELEARDRLFAAGFEPIPPRFAERAREQVDLWDLALERFGVDEVGAACAASLLNLGRTALLAGDDELAVAVQQRVRGLVASWESLRALPEERRVEAATTIDVRAFDADVDEAIGRPGEGASTLCELVRLLEDWGGYPSEELSDCERALREANLVGRFVQLSIGGGDLAVASKWVDRYLALLELAHSHAVADGDEFVDAATIRLLENVAELATRGGRPDVRAAAVARLPAWTTDLAARDSVYGRILHGELPETLARLRALDP